MKIGIDLRALQTGHKYRGIGEVAKQTTNRILQLAAEDVSQENSFIFYEYDDDDPKELLDIPKTITYEVIKLGKNPETDTIATKQDKLWRHINNLFLHPIQNSAKSDVFLQFDYAFGVPKNTKTLLIKHDLIPLIFWDKYFESAWIPFKNKAARTTLRTLFANHSFTYLLRRSLRNSHTIIAVSASTKHDIEKFFNVKPSKIKVAHLGVDIKPAKTNSVDMSARLPTKPYLLFVGAGDSRRRVDDAVAAYNNLKAEGHDLQLVLAGENFKSPEKIPTKFVRDAVLGSSYADDILTLGYIDDKTKQKLFRDALAFVYPTLYEGFGIPVLEAMLMECPVISYKNSSIEEVGGRYIRYARNWAEIKVQVEQIIAQPNEEMKKQKAAAKKHAEEFTWDKTAIIIYDELISMKKA